MSNYYVLVSDAPFVSGDLSEVLAQAGVSIFHETTIAGTPSTIPTGTTGRYVRIQNSGAGFVALAEVEIMGCALNNGSGGSNLIVRATEERGIDAVLYPNPANEAIIVKYDTRKAGKLRYIIANGLGVIYKEETLMVEEGDGKILTEVKQWPAGPYIFYLQMEGYRYKQIPFVRIRD